MPMQLKDQGMPVRLTDQKTPMYLVGTTRIDPGNLEGGKHGCRPRNNASRTKVNLARRTTTDVGHGGKETLELNLLPHSNNR